jgi:hypothetical protein
MDINRQDLDKMWQRSQSIEYLDSSNFANK